MKNKLLEHSRLWLGAFALLAFGSLAGCISDDSDPAEDDETGGTGGSGTGGSSGSATGGSSGSSTGGSGGGGPAGTACEAPIKIATSSPGIADFEGYMGQMPLKDWSMALGGETASCEAPTGGIPKSTTILSIIDLTEGAATAPPVA